MRRQKAAKRSTKRTATATPANYNEKEFLSTPAKLAAQANKEASAHKQKVTQLTKAVARNKSEVKTAEARVKAAAKNKQTAAGKKQWNALKKIHAAVAQTQKELARELNDASKSFETIATKANKWQALGTYLSQFDKVWAKSSRKVKSKSKTRINKKTKTQPVLTQTPSTFAEDSYYTNDSPATNDVMSEEPTEATA